ncbi:MAG: DUF1849 family protein [Rhodospirillales bacterium]|jgi:hypothetical protein|nr:hypothetical protein [Rhodospirillaceae bacterium]MDP6428010.1 DUF1849 family protein [Rhodospirillales bacterium]MDP6645270.1 DUF1849 family protein [Rhodospirillales bacterium]MDP6843352.1 DUF1849 family protein [Rhodospirillales bacterium]|tara:strand:+ start:383 stop:1240 length:858 start_codon:yes stop_codon:yes gene_type:complete
MIKQAPKSWKFPNWPAPGKAVFAALVVSVSAVPDAFAADGILVPHRAIYAMSLSTTGSASGPSAVRGVMSYEFADKCDGWQVNTRVLLRTSYGAGPEVENLRVVKTWEAKDGLGFRFRVTETHAGRQRSRIKGVAVLDENGGGVAEYTLPSEHRITLPRGTMFPIRHIEAMIRRAKAGGGHFGNVVFDGATEDEPYQVSAVIGAQETTDRRTPGIKKVLRRVKSWMARLAYFPVEAVKDTPAFALNISYREDGIVERMTQYYGDHAIEVRLQQIELLPKDGCALR